ncbi:MAG: protein jag [Clostridiaceae bacterium]|nr:protein jag [Clostridiaceae bacterium]
MSTVLEKMGRTVEEAISRALDELKVERSQVDVEVLDEGNKGIFGLIGTKTARVRVTLKETPGERVKKFLDEVFEKMNLNVQMVVEEDDKAVYVKIEGEDSGIIIGRRGETLEALQFLSCLVVNNGKGDYKKVIIDIENYRKRREDTLVKLSHKLAERVIKSKKNITLEPMSPYERRIIHSTLQNNKYVKTYSIGDEPNRKVVISLK